MMHETSQIAKFTFSELSIQNYEKIADFIQKNGVATQKEIADATSLGPSVIKRGIKELKNEGLIIKKRETRGRKSLYQWVGGTSAVEDELESATSKFVTASLLAETYDLLINDAFALFSIIFDGYGWEVIANLREGRTDTEIHQSLGNDVSLDSIRRILVISDAHDLIKIKRIRTPAGPDGIKLFEPLYRIDSINKNHLEYLLLFRGLASAFQYRTSGQKMPGYSLIFDKMLDTDIQMLIQLKDKIMSKTAGEEHELFMKLLSNYDYASDLDRVYGEENWRLRLNQSKNLKLGTDDHLMVSDNFLNR
jgi:transcription initiation factor IIE alpha subunit